MKFQTEEILFSPTADCNLNCAHCDIQKSKLTLSKKLAQRFLRDAKRLGIKRVGFTGGEPFLAPDFIFSVVRTAVKEEMLFDRIMTNGAWYKNYSEAKTALTKLYRAGYDGSICVSVDAFHKQALTKVARFIDMAVSIWRRPDVVSIACVVGARDSLTKKRLQTLSGLLNADLVGFETTHPYIKNDNLSVKISKIDLSPIGKASRLRKCWLGTWFREDYCKGPGNVFFVGPSGDVKPCCGYAIDSKDLSIGNIKRDSARRIAKRAEENRFVFTVFNKGLTKIRKRLEGLKVKFPGKASNHCFFCNYILTRVPRPVLYKCLD